ncbi:MAG: DNRLRE domain-containing protein, partial [Planctomycetales bacterium]|nr:DNRLRE domain-containing protein [Planctomycetales bacterium]
MKRSPHKARKRAARPSKSARSDFQRQIRCQFETLEDRRLLTATPGLEPLLFVPGFAGTFAADESESGVTEWLTNRGLAPEKLQLEPLANTYNDIVQTLENVGYVQGETLFVVHWDYRVPVAPVDADAITSRDGILSSVSVSGITDDVYETGLDYLGDALKDAVDAYAAANGGAALDKVDILSHSTGGLITRSYIQSPAYAQGGLPSIDDFLMVGVPNKGAIGTWEFLNDDWNGSPAERILGQAVNLAYEQLQDGTPILGPDAGSTSDDITDPNINKLDFIRKYVGAAKHLTPTYAAMDFNGDGELEEIPNTRPEFNDLLNDLNAAGNSYLDAIGNTTIIYATEAETPDQIIQRAGPSEDGFLRDEILNFSTYVGRRPEAGETWFERTASGHGGDNSVPNFSSIDPFLGDPRVGSNLTLLPIRAEDAGGNPVVHTALVNNVYSQGRILDSLGVTGFTTADISTDNLRTTVGSGLKVVDLGLVRAGDAFRDAGAKFKSVVSEAFQTRWLDAEMAFTELKLNERFDLAALWQDKFLTPIEALLATNPGASTSDIASTLGPGFTDASAGDELAIRFSFDAADLSALNSDHTLNLGSDYGGLLAGADFEFLGDLTFEGTLGLNRAAGFNYDEALFVRDLNLSVGGRASIEDLNLDIGFGGIKAAIENGHFNMDARVGISLAGADSAGTLTLAQLTNGLDNLSSILNIEPSSSLDLQLPLNLTNANTGFDLNKFGTPVISAASENLFNGSADFLIDMELNSALQDQILSVLSSLDERADELGESEFLTSEIPGIGQSLNGLLGEDGSGAEQNWTNLLKLEHAAADYFARFDPASLGYDPSTLGTQPTALGLRDALAASIQLDAGLSGNAGKPPISISGGVDLTNNELRFEVDVDASLLRSVPLSFDALGPIWQGLDIGFNADAVFEATASVAMDLDFGVGLSQSTGVDPFFNLHQFDVAAALDASGSSFGFDIGPIEGTITASALAVSAGASFTFVPGAAPLRDRISVEATSSFETNLAFASSLYGKTITLPGLGISDNNLFDATPPIFIGDLTQFAFDLSAENVVDGLFALAQWLDDALLQGELSSTKIPLINKSVGELLSTPAESREFGPAEVIAISAPVAEGDVQRFRATLNTFNTLGRRVTALGIRPGAEMRFLSTSGDRFPASVESVNGEEVVLTYAASRTDTPDLTNPALTFEVGGTLGDHLRAALVNFNDPQTAVPSLGVLLNELAGPLGIDFGAITYDSAGKILTLTPTFSPNPIAYETTLDFGEEITGLAFQASGKFMVAAAPTVRLPLRIRLGDGIASDQRVVLIDDAQPEVSVALTAGLDDPQARASLGFLAAVLAEDPTVASNEGIQFTTNLDLDIDDPDGPNDAGAEISFSEITSDLTNSLDASFSGTLDIDGVLIKPEIAGATIPGEIEIFTTTDGTTRGVSSFDNFSELGSLFSKISIGNSIGSTESLTPEAVVTMFIQLGNSLQNVANELDVPEGLPFIDDAISEVVRFIDTTGDFARQLYFNASLVGDNDIAITDGRLSEDAHFAIRMEGSPPVFVTVLAADTADNATIDDLFEDVNAALTRAGLGGFVIAERQTPFDASKLTDVLDVTGEALGPAVAPLNGLSRYRFNVDPSINLFNLGLKIGDVIEYRDSTGRIQTASIDEMTLHSLFVRFDAARQLPPEIGSERQLAVFDPAHRNRLAIRTTDPSVGVSMTVSTLQFTASEELAPQLENDVTLSFDLDDEVETLTITADATSSNLSVEDLIDDLNAAVLDTDLEGRIQFLLAESFLRIAIIDSAVEVAALAGAETLGFPESGADASSATAQKPDANTASSELGLGVGQRSESEFRANTIQDLVHTLNGLIMEGVDGSPFSASLQYIEEDLTQTPHVSRGVAFNLSIASEFTETISLNFDEGLDVGFAQLGIAGGGDGVFTATAGAELRVGFDLDPPSSGEVLADSTLLSALDEGRGLVVEVGITGSPVSTNGQSTPLAAQTLSFDVSQLDTASIEVSVTVPQSEIADNISVDDLAADLNAQLHAFDYAAVGLPPVEDGTPPVEVQVEGDRLILVSTSEAINGLTINSSTSSFLGFTPGQVGDRNDLAITLRNGSEFFVNLDFAETMGDVKQAILDAAVAASATDPSIVAPTVEYQGDQLKLTDNTTGDSRFRVAAAVDAIGVSTAAATLGILRVVDVVEDIAETPEDESNDGSILLGETLFTGTLLDQFYIDAANSSIFANASIDASDINLVASLGILDLGVKDGTVVFSVDASLGLSDYDNPETPGDESLDGKLRLQDFSAAGFGDILTPSFTYGGEADLPIDGTALAFLPGDFQQGGATPMAITASIDGADTPLKPELNFEVTNLEAAVGSFKNFGLEDIAVVIQNVVELLQNSDIEGLNTPIPVINKSPNEVLDIVDSFAAAAEKILAGPDLELLAEQVVELEALIEEMPLSPSQAEALEPLILQLKSAVRAEHMFTLGLPQSGGAVSRTTELDANASAGELKDALDAALGAGVVEKVSGKRGGPFTITFAASQGDVEPLQGRSVTGLPVQTETVTDGVTGTTSEVQKIRFAKMGNMIGVLAAMRSTVAALPSLDGKSETLAKVEELQDGVVSHGNLGTVVGDIIKQELGLPDDAFQLTLNFVDADSNQPGFQAAAIIQVDIEKSVTERVGFDFELPDLGPITVETGAEIDFTVGGDLDLDFGFRFGTFTPYLLNTTAIALNASIDSLLDVQAGIAGISGGLTGNLKLQGSVTETPAANATEFTLAEEPLDGLVVIHDGTRTLDRGTDYTLETSNSPPTVQFTNPTTAATEIQYAPAVGASQASIGVSVDPTLVPSDNNTLGGIPFSQLFSTFTPLSDKFDFNVSGIASASLDANLASAHVPDAITVVLSLDHPTQPQIEFDGITDYLENLVDPSQISLGKLITGTRTVLETVEAGLTSDLLEQLPLIGEGVDLGASFVGKLKSMLDSLETEIANANGTLQDASDRIKRAIFDVLGPRGANILVRRVDGLTQPITVFSDVEVFFPDLLSTPAADFEFTINLSLAGRDVMDVNFDLGVDTIDFDIRTQGGVELAWDYNFDFGFGVSLTRGFFFQLNNNVTYDSIGQVESGTPEISLSAQVNLKPGTSLTGGLFFLNLGAESNAIEDYNRDGILNNGGTGIDPVTGLMQGPKLNEAMDGIDYNLNGTLTDELTEEDLDGNGRLSKGTGLAGNIFVDINDPNNDQRLTLNELIKTPKNDLFNAGITTEAFVDLHLSADTDFAGLPKVFADLTLDWAIGLTTRDGLIGGGLPEIALHDVTIDVGSIFGTSLAPVFRDFVTYVGPLKPMLDFLVTPVPGINHLSELINGPEFTFLTLAILSGKPDKAAIRASKIGNQVIRIVQNIFDFADSVNTLIEDGDGLMLNFGSFYVTGKPLAVTGDELTPIAGTGDREFLMPENPRTGTHVRVFSDGIELDRGLYDIVKFKEGGANKTKLVFRTAQSGDITADYTTTEGGVQDLLNPEAEVRVDMDSLDTVSMGAGGGLSNDVLDQTTSGSNASKPGASKTRSALKKLTGAANSAGDGGFGIKIPLLSDPSNIFKLFTGEKADIVQWKLPELSLKVPFSKEFGPIPIEPSPLYVTIGASLEVFANLSIGFDTRGLITDNFLDGLYFGDLAGVTTGEDIEEFVFILEASIGAAIKKGPFAAGLEGVLRGTFGFDWNDLDGDGKLYPDELLALAQLTPDEGPPIPGICVFDTRGEFDAVLRAYLDTPIHRFNFDLVEARLFDFNINCSAPNVAELGTVDSDVRDGTLQLFAGPYAEKRTNFYGTDINEVFEVRQFEDTDAESETFGETVTEVTFHYTNRDQRPATVVERYTGVERILFEGGSGNDTVTIDPSVTVPVSLSGGAGNDVLIGGSGNDLIEGGLGNDRLQGGLGNDRYIFGDEWGIDVAVEPENAPDAEDSFDFSSVTTSLDVRFGSVSVSSGANTVTGGLNEAGETVQTEGIEGFLAGRGSDTLTVGKVVGSATRNTWEFFDDGRGRINDAFTFGNFENLVGGPQDDHFVIDATDRRLGVISGGGGTDTLDYSSFDSQSPVFVDLRVGTAPVVRSFSGFEAIIGGQSKDNFLFGANVDATWTISGQDSGVFATSESSVAFDNFAFLEGGHKNDHFIVGADGSITGHVVGTTAFASRILIHPIFGGPSTIPLNNDGLTDSDSLDLSALSNNLKLHVRANNAGTVSGTLLPMNFFSVEGVKGGSGDDEFEVDPGFVMRGTLDGGVGDRDHLNFHNWTSTISVDLTAGTLHSGFVAGMEDVTGGSAADSITGNASANRLIGLGGNDVIRGAGGDDILIGDQAVITTQDGVVSSIRTIAGREFNDRLFASGGNNILLPGSGDDFVDAQGNNIVAGDQALLTLSGGQVVTMQSTTRSATGNDTINLSDGTQIVLAGEGNDTVNVANGGSVIVADRGTITLLNGLPSSARSEWSTTAGHDNISLGQGIHAIIAGGGNDGVRPAEPAEENLPGASYVLGDDGSIEFAAGIAVSSTLNLTESDGNDEITTGDGADTIFTGNGDNTVNAGGGNDSVTAGAGIDMLNGQGGNDWLVGMLGDDTVDGGDGNDVMFGGLPTGVWADYQLGTTDFTLPPEFTATEELYPTGYTPAILITPAILGGLSIDGVAGDGRDQLAGGAGNDVLLGGSDVDELRGGLGVDYLDAGAGSDLVVQGGEGDDVIRGGAGNDLINGGTGIDQVYGDAGDDRLFGEAGATGDIQAGQRLYGGEGRDELFAFAPTTTPTEFSLVGDQLFGGAGGDFLHGNLRQEILIGGSGNDFIAGDEFAGPAYQSRIDADINGAADLIQGGSGEDQLFGGGGDDEIWGGSGTDFIDGQNGSDKQYGGSGIDLFVLNASYSGIDDTDGHFGNMSQGDVADDNATDILTIDGTTADDTILIGQTVAGQAALLFNGSLLPVNMLSANGELLIEQFRIAGLGGNDTLGFVSDSATAAGVLAGINLLGLQALETAFLSERSDDFVGVFDGNSGDDLLLGSDGRDRLDGGIGSDTAFGFGGDDRLWGDTGGGSTNDQDVLYAGQGNDDLVGGQGTNKLYAWSFDPAPDLIAPLPDGLTYDQGFGVFVDEFGALFHDDGDLNDNNILDADDDVVIGPIRLARIHEITGLNRMLGNELADMLFGGTTLDFMYGNGGDDTLIRSDGTTFESADGGLAGDEWKEYARESDQVWYVGGTNAADEINVDFVTEPGLLTDHHLITRLTENNGNFSFAAQVRLDFQATDGEGNPIWDSGDLQFKLDQLLAEDDPTQRGEALSDIAAGATAIPEPSELLASFIPPEGDFLVILIDALGGNDQITVGPTVQKTVWVDAGAGDDVVTIRSGNAILVDRAESARGNTGLASRNDIPAQYFDLFGPSQAADVDPLDLVAFDATELDSKAVTFTGLSLDNPDDQDWFGFQLTESGNAAGSISLASGSPIDNLEMKIYLASDIDPATGQLLEGATPVGPASTTTGDASQIADLSSLAVDVPYVLQISGNQIPTLYDLRFNLNGIAEPAIAASPSISMSLRKDTVRRDVILGGDGDDILQGGAGEDWVFGNAGNDVLTGGSDRQSSDLLFGGSGDDTFQIIPDALPLLGNQPDTNFDPATETFIPTYSDQFIGGDGTDRVLFLGGDTDRRGLPVPDYAAIRYNTGLHRYEFTSLVWDIGAQEFVTTTDALGRTVYEQEYFFYQTRDVEQTEFDTRAGDDVVQASPGFTFQPVATFPSLQHRYSFDEVSGTVLTDSVGGAHATIVDLNDSGLAKGGGGHEFVSGQLRLYGGANATADYVELPDTILDGLTDATFEVWATRESVTHWSRIFDFGAGTSEFLLAAWSNGSNGMSNRVHWVAGANSLIEDPFNISDGQEVHLAIAIDEGGGTGGLTRVTAFQDGIAVGSFDTSNKLSDLTPSNNWLGRSKFAGDATADASYNEFRIHNRTLTSIELGLSNALGPDSVTSVDTDAEAWGIDLGDFEQGAHEAALAINLGAGNDYAFGTVLADTIIGGPGNDTIAGNAGNDEIEGGGGNDTLFGNTPDSASASNAYPASPTLPVGFTPGQFASELFSYELATPTLPFDVVRTGVDLNNTTTTNVTIEAPANPVAYYSFDNASDLTVDDSGSGNAIGTVTGVTASGSGVSGGAAAFADQSSVLLIGSDGLNLGSEWTASAWFKGLVDSPSWNTLFRGFNGDHQIIMNNGTTELGVYGSSVFFRDSGHDLDLAGSADVWQQVTAVGQNGQTDLFVNGVYVGTSDYQPSSNFYAIGNHQSGNQQFASELDEVYLYDRAISGSEVYDLYQSGFQDNRQLEIASDSVEESFGLTADDDEFLSPLESVGDFNGDGFDDFVSRGLTQSYLFFGPLALQDAEPVADLASAVIDHESLGRIGHGRGDVDGNGVSDLTFTRTQGEQTVVTVVFGGDFNNADSHELTSWPSRWDEAFVQGSLITTGADANASVIEIPEAMLSLQGTVTTHLLNYTGDPLADVLVISDTSASTPSFEIGDYLLGYVFSGQDIVTSVTSGAESLGFTDATTTIRTEGRVAGLETVVAGDLNGDGRDEILFGATDLSVQQIGGVQPAQAFFDLPINNGQSQKIRIESGSLAASLIISDDYKNADEFAALINEALSSTDLASHIAADVVGLEIRLYSLESGADVEFSASSVVSGESTQSQTFSLDNLGVTFDARVIEGTVFPGLGSFLLSASGLSGSITNIELQLDVSHSFASDVSATLFSPLSTEVLILDGVGGSGDNFSGTVFRDDAIAPIRAGSAPFSDRPYRPEESLSNFDGISANGFWELRVADDSPENPVTVNSFGLTFTTETLVPFKGVGQVTQALSAPIVSPMTTPSTLVRLVPGSQFQSLSPSALGDINSDGRADVSLAFGNRVELYQGETDLSSMFTAPLRTIAVEGSTVTAGDFDANGLSDIVVAVPTGSTGNAGLYVFNDIVAKSTSDVLGIEDADFILPIDTLATEGVGTLTFDGIDDRAILPSEVLQGLTEMTTTFWTDDLRMGNPRASIVGGGKPDAFFFGLNIVPPSIGRLTDESIRTDSLQFIMNAPAGFIRLNFPIDESIDLNERHHFAVTRESTGHVEVRMNGISIGRQNAPIIPIDLGSSTNLLLGATPSSASSFDPDEDVILSPIATTLDEFTVWNRSLSQREILGVINGEFEEDANGLVAWYDFGPSDALQLTDRNGQYHGRIPSNATIAPLRNTTISRSLSAAAAVDVNADGIDDLVFSSRQSTADAFSHVAIINGAYSLPTGQFEVLENFSVAGSGSFITDRGTGRPAIFDNGGSGYSLGIDEQQYFRFTTLGDGKAGNSIRLPAGVLSDLLDQRGGVISVGRRAHDLRASEAGTYYLRVYRDNAGPMPETFSIEFAAPIRGQTHESTTHPDRDVIDGGDGDDVIAGNNDLDAIFGGSGADTITAEPTEVRDLGIADATLGIVPTSELVSGNVPAPIDPVVIESAYSPVIFFDDFESGDFGKWASSTTATVDEVGINEPSGRRSARFNGTHTGGDLVLSPVLDLSDARSAQLKYYVQQGGGGDSPETNDDLSVEYSIDGGTSWSLLQKHLGSSQNQPTYGVHTIALPGLALSSNFQFRILNIGTPSTSTSPLDDWFVDDVSVVVQRGVEPELRAAVAQELGMPVTVARDGRPLIHDDLRLTDIGALTDLSVPSVSNLSVLQHAVNLESLDASLQSGPAVVTASHDTTISEWQKDSYRGSSPLVLAGANGHRHTALLRFDVAEIGQVTSDATLRVFLNMTSSSRTQTIQVRESLSAWGEASTWNTVPGGPPSGTIGSEVLDTRTLSTVAGAAGRYVEFSIPQELLQRWIDDPTNNNGIALVSTTTTSGQDLSLSGSESANPPVLEFDSVRAPLNESSLVALIPRRLSSGPQAGELLGTPKLKSLDLSGQTNITDISALASLTSLETLHLDGTGINLADASTRETLENLPNLQTLTLSALLLDPATNVAVQEGDSVSIPFQAVTALEFDGVDDQVDLNATFSDLGFDGDFTVSTWVR